ncbi:MAG: DNA-processing protein DprA [Acidimicrobiales bacterium]|nr:DNA-processing protein DprA [Acidimicrobiales bacterium]
MTAPLRLERDDPRYPASLRALTDPPPTLWVRGTTPVTGALAIVGTRAPSERGRRAAALLTVEAVDRGWGTVAGLAAGVDEIVHESTLAANGRSWAFIGDGVDAPELPALAARLTATGGGILSEQPPGTTATTNSRRLRDRLQAASAAAVIVVEASDGCGTLHTVAAARRLGRPVILVRPDPEHPAASGSRALAAALPDLVMVDADGGSSARWERIDNVVSVRP